VCVTELILKCDPKLFGLHPQGKAFDQILAVLGILADLQFFAHKAGNTRGRKILVDVESHIPQSVDAAHSQEILWLLKVQRLHKLWQTPKSTRTASRFLTSASVRIANWRFRSSQLSLASSGDSNMSRMRHLVGSCNFFVCLSLLLLLFFSEGCTLPPPRRGHSP